MKVLEIKKMLEKTKLEGELGEEAEKILQGYDESEDLGREDAEKLAGLFEAGAEVSDIKAQYYGDVLWSLNSYVKSLESALDLAEEEVDSLE
ncbi:hypothetical protein A2574_03460 [Candidatus Shapirobacteria bacterium RIFOXYD1_FULL_38_32]|jgi:hypothetical protein|uniref:Uncharacterized protein n=2 Tax=Candidatus Shapironibacteriota TaxID=1752721 RepID=A0A1F7SWW2_9BACT|nr:MAG: hypothetical protein UT14_C0011G0003 [Candidatus Shapirobacteria bacterium GW2011_GWE1_38_92]OGL56613.1 MAG: hypothetical protein A2195_02555 [Candidatus Shapirobacteria bacterium RIFOXYA1_FULL_39_17]OGL57406.1 MAG: hypothetical protein A2410_01805 [Candidatus Shapirobacteria bacterium RIFOXYC1_FULL_38_24]OGL57694.1 MAG: hypothetical protein A2367_00975 [Candidatus Shapirobacteria bacterium RIFOXYB1_FULL_38_38]OGL58430.1 MAG: hypothetical protein A2574_03460 [Candidatus Shapirobacteria 